jgi:hypothetical protein
MGINRIKLDFFGIYFGSLDFISWSLVLRVFSYYK